MTELDRVAIRAAADDLHGMCSDRGFSDAVSVLRDATPVLLSDLDRAEQTLAAIRSVWAGFASPDNCTSDEETIRRIGAALTKDPE